MPQLGGFVFRSGHPHTGLLPIPCERAIPNRRRSPAGGSLCWPARLEFVPPNGDQPGASCKRCQPNSESGKAWRLQRTRRRMPCNVRLFKVLISTASFGTSPRSIKLSFVADQPNEAFVPRPEVSRFLHFCEVDRQRFGRGRRRWNERCNQSAMSADTSGILGNQLDSRANRGGSDFDRRTGWSQAGSGFYQGRRPRVRY